MRKENTCRIMNAERMSLAEDIIVFLKDRSNLAG